MSTIDEAGWRPCPSGELRRLAGRLATRRQRQRAFALFLAAAALVTAGVTAIAVIHHVLADVNSSGTVSAPCSSRPTAPAAPTQPCP